MALRLDNVGIVVEDLAPAIEFFGELGLELEGRALVEGEWAGRVTGVRIIAVSTRWSPRPVTRPAYSPSTKPRPSSSRPSSRKNSIAGARSSTTMPTLSSLRATWRA